MSDQAVTQRVGQWWALLDPTTKSMFEQIFAEQPELAVRVLSGGAVAAPEGGATSLEDLFGGVDPFAIVSPQYGISDEPAVDPAYPEVGTPFTVTYTVNNYGSDAPAERTDAVRVLDNQGNSVAEEPATGMALPAGGSESMQVNIASGLPADGRYDVQVWVNLDGAPQGAPANEHGTQTAAGTTMAVGAYESEAGPATGDQTFRDQATMLADDARMVQNTYFSAAEQLEHFRQFLARAQAMVNAAATDYPAVTGYGTALGDCANRLEGIDPSRVAWRDNEAQEASVNLLQAALPFSMLPYDENLLEYVPPLVEAARVLVGYYR